MHEPYIKIKVDFYCRGFHTVYIYVPEFAKKLSDRDREPFVLKELAKALAAHGEVPKNGKWESGRKYYTQDTFLNEPTHDDQIAIITAKYA